MHASGRPRLRTAGSLCWVMGRGAPVKTAAEQGCGTCWLTDSQCHQRPELGEVRTMRDDSQICVILAQGKTGLLGNDGNTVTRQDEPRPRF